MTEGSDHGSRAPGRGIWFEETGLEGAPLVVLVHGSMDRSNSFAAVRRRLIDRFRVVVLDRWGYGRSAGLSGGGTIAEHVIDIGDVLGGRRAILVGHSAGGSIVTTAACRWPELVRAVVAYEPPMTWHPIWPAQTAGGRAASIPDPAEAAEVFMRTLIGDANWEKLPARTREARRSEGFALRAEGNSLRAGAPYSPEQLRCPLVMAFGSAGTAHHRLGIDLWEQWRPDGGDAGGDPSTRLEVRCIEGAMHGAHLSHPQEFSELVDLAAALADAADAAHGL